MAHHDYYSAAATDVIERFINNRSPFKGANSEREPGPNPLYEDWKDMSNQPPEVGAIAQVLCLFVCVTLFHEIRPMLSSRRITIALHDLSNNNRYAKNPES